MVIYKTMQPTPFVSTQEVSIAREVEQVLLELPEEIGILFVGVKTTSLIVGGCFYSLVVGYGPDYDPATVVQMVQLKLRKELPDLQIHEITVMRGKVRSAFSS